MNSFTFTARPYLYNQQQRQPPQPTQEMASQSHDSSQSQTQSQSQSQPYHDQSQSSQDYYAYYQHQYPYYYNQDFSNTYNPQQQQQHSQEPTSIHPPGVAIAPSAAPLAGSEPTQMQYHQNAYYYPQGVVEHQQQQGSYSDFASQGFQGQQWGVDANAPPLYGGPGFARPPRQSSSYRGGGRRGGRKGVGRSHFAPPHAQSHAFPVWPPPQLAWCELCRVDCNTIQILEQHRNGKKHKKNLQRLEELQNLNKVINETRNAVPVHKPTPQLRPTAMEPEKGPVSEEKQATPHNVPPEAVTGTSTFETVAPQSMEKTTLAGPAEEKEKCPRTNKSSARGRSFKRSMRGGRGAHKRIRSNDLARQPVEPPKPKVVIPLVCELCNVKCESQVVFETHVAGKKHISKLKRLPGYQAIVGAAIQALQPPNPKAPPPLFKLQVNQQGLQPHQGMFTHPQPHVIPDAKVPTGGPAQTLLYLESKDEPDSACHGVQQPISETETLDARQDENGGGKTVLVESETPSAATVGLKMDDEGSLGSGGGKVTTPFENSSVAAAGQALSFKAIDEATSSSGARSPPSSPRVVLSEQESSINRGPEVMEDDPTRPNEDAGLPSSS